MIPGMGNTFQRPTEDEEPLEEDSRARRKRLNREKAQQLIEQSLAGGAVSAGVATPEQALMVGADPASPGAPVGAPVAHPGAGMLSELAPLGDFGPMRPTQFNQDLFNTALGSGPGQQSSYEGKMSPASIAAAAARAGFKGNDLVKAIAVAMAESRGNPGAIGDRNLSTQGEQSTGLWQINFRPGRDEGNKTRDPQANLDPFTNAQNAYKIFQDQGWRAWSVTHGTPQTNNNHYSKFLDEARRAAAQFGGSGGAGSNIKPR